MQIQEAQVAAAGCLLFMSDGGWEKTVPVVGGPGLDGPWPPDGPPLSCRQTHHQRV